MALPKKPRDYETRVFINCPFDDAYKPLFDAIVFAIHDLGFQARHALIDNSKAVRVTRILDEIICCKYSIHDLSRVETGANNLPRFNMPFEAGIAYAVYAIAPAKREHHIAVFEAEPYRHAASISDLAGLDPKAHAGSPEKAIGCVREFLRRKSGLALPGAAHVFKRYTAFEAMLVSAATAGRMSLIELNSLSYANDKQSLVAEWIQANPA